MSAPRIELRLEDLEASDLPLERAIPAAIRIYLKASRSHLEALHRESGSGRLVNEANSDLTDSLIRRLFAVAEELILAEGGELEDFMTKSTSERTWIAETSVFFQYFYLIHYSYSLRQNNLVYFYLII